MFERKYLRYPANSFSSSFVEKQPLSLLNVLWVTNESENYGGLIVASQSLNWVNSFHDCGLPHVANVHRSSKTLVNPGWVEKYTDLGLEILASGGVFCPGVDETHAPPQVGQWDVNRNRCRLGSSDQSAASTISLD